MQSNFPRLKKSDMLNTSSPVDQKHESQSHEFLS